MRQAGNKGGFSPNVGSPMGRGYASAQSSGTPSKVSMQGFTGQVGGQNARQAANANQPTHSAFAQPADRGGNFPSAGMYGGLDKAEMSRPPVRNGAIYGALDALQAAAKSIREPDDKTELSGMPADSGRPSQSSRFQSQGLTPEQVWQSIPSGGEAAWKSSQPRQALRLRVARLQEALSEAASGLQRAAEVVSGAGEDDFITGSLGAAALGPPGMAAALRNECAALEAESKELEEEKSFLDARVLEVKQELARMKEVYKPAANRSPTSPLSNGPSSPGTAPETRQKIASAEDVSELAVVLRLLACLKDLALSNRSVLLASDPATWTREQQVVAYFLDEVEACQSRITTPY